MRYNVFMLMYISREIGYELEDTYFNGCDKTIINRIYLLSTIIGFACGFGLSIIFCIWMGRRRKKLWLLTKDEQPLIDVKSKIPLPGSNHEIPDNKCDVANLHSNNHPQLQLGAPSSPSPSTSSAAPAFTSQSPFSFSHPPNSPETHVISEGVTSPEQDHFLKLKYTNEIEPSLRFLQERRFRNEKYMEYVDYVYQLAIKRHRNNTQLLFQYGCFLSYFKKNYAKASVVFRQIQYSNASISLRFVLFCKNAESDRSSSTSERGDNNEQDSEVATLTFKSMLYRAMEHHAEAKQTLSEFWENIIQQHPNFNLYPSQLRQVVASEAESRRCFEELLRAHPLNVQLLRMYGQLLMDIYREDETAALIFLHADQIEEEESREVGFFTPTLTVTLSQPGEAVSPTSQDQKEASFNPQAPFESSKSRSPSSTPISSDDDISRSRRSNAITDSLFCERARLLNGVSAAASLNEDNLRSAPDGNLVNKDDMRILNSPHSAFQEYCHANNENNPCNHQKENTQNRIVNANGKAMGSSPEFSSNEVKEGFKNGRNENSSVTKNEVISLEESHSETDTESNSDIQDDNVEMDKVPLLFAGANEKKHTQTIKQYHSTRIAEDVQKHSSKKLLGVKLKGHSHDKSKKRKKKKKKKNKLLQNKAAAQQALIMQLADSMGPKHSQLRMNDKKFFIAIVTGMILYCGGVIGLLFLFIENRNKDLLCVKNLYGMCQLSAITAMFAVDSIQVLAHSADYNNALLNGSAALAIEPLADILSHIKKCSEEFITHFADVYLSTMDSSSWESASVSLHIIDMDNSTTTISQMIPEQVTMLSAITLASQSMSQVGSSVNLETDVPYYKEHLLLLMFNSFLPIFDGEKLIMKDYVDLANNSYFSAYVVYLVCISFLTLLAFGSLSMLYIYMVSTLTKRRHESMVQLLDIPKIKIQNVLRRLLQRDKDNDDDTHSKTRSEDTLQMLTNQQNTTPMALVESQPLVRQGSRSTIPLAFLTTNQLMAQQEQTKHAPADHTGHPFVPTLLQSHGSGSASKSEMVRSLSQSIFPSLNNTLSMRSLAQDTARSHFPTIETLSSNNSNSDSVDSSEIFADRTPLLHHSNSRKSFRNASLGKHIDIFALADKVSHSKSEKIMKLCTSSGSDEKQSKKTQKRQTSDSFLVRKNRNLGRKNSYKKNDERTIKGEYSNEETKGKEQTKEENEMSDARHMNYSQESLQSKKQRMSSKSISSRHSNKSEKIREKEEDKQLRAQIHLANAESQSEIKIVEPLQVVEKQSRALSSPLSEPHRHRVMSQDNFSYQDNPRLPLSSAAALSPNAAFTENVSSEQDGMTLSHMSTGSRFTSDNMGLDKLEMPATFLSHRTLSESFEGDGQSHTELSSPETPAVFSSESNLFKSSPFTPVDTTTGSSSASSSSMSSTPTSITTEAMIRKAQWNIGSFNSRDSQNQQVHSRSHLHQHFGGRDAESAAANGQANESSGNQSNQQQLFLAENEGTIDEEQENGDNLCESNVKNEEADKSGECIVKDEDHDESDASSLSTLSPQKTSEKLEGKIHQTEVSRNVQGASERAHSPTFQNAPSHQIAQDHTFEFLLPLSPDLTIASSTTASSHSLPLNNLIQNQNSVLQASLFSPSSQKSSISASGTISSIPSIFSPSGSCSMSAIQQGSAPFPHSSHHLLLHSSTESADGVSLDAHSLFNLSISRPTTATSTILSSLSASTSASTDIYGYESYLLNPKMLQSQNYESLSSGNIKQNLAPPTMLLFPNRTNPNISEASTQLTCSTLTLPSSIDDIDDIDEFEEEGFHSRFVDINQVKMNAYSSNNDQKDNLESKQNETIDNNEIEAEAEDGFDNYIHTFESTISDISNKREGSGENDFAFGGGSGLPKAEELSTENRLLFTSTIDTDLSATGDHTCERYIADNQNVSDPQVITSGFVHCPLRWNSDPLLVERKKESQEKQSKNASAGKSDGTPIYKENPNVQKNMGNTLHEEKLAQLNGYVNQNYKRDIKLGDDLDRANDKSMNNTTISADEEEVEEERMQREFFEAASNDKQPLQPEEQHDSTLNILQKPELTELRNVNNQSPEMLTKEPEFDAKVEEDDAQGAFRNDVPDLSDESKTTSESQFKGETNSLDTHEELSHNDSRSSSHSRSSKPDLALHPSASQSSTGSFLPQASEKLSSHNSTPSSPKSSTANDGKSAESSHIRNDSVSSSEIPLKKTQDTRHTTHSPSSSSESKAIKTETSLTGKTAPPTSPTLSSSPKMNTTLTIILQQQQIQQLQLQLQQQIQESQLQQLQLQQSGMAMSTDLFTTPSFQPSHFISPSLGPTDLPVTSSSLQNPSLPDPHLMGSSALWQPPIFGTGMDVRKSNVPDDSSNGMYSLRPPALLNSTAPFNSQPSPHFPSLPLPDISNSFLPQTFHNDPSKFPFYANNSQSKDGSIQPSGISIAQSNETVNLHLSHQTSPGTSSATSENISEKADRPQKRQKRRKKNVYKKKENEEGTGIFSSTTGKPKSSKTPEAVLQLPSIFPVKPEVTDKSFESQSTQSSADHGFASTSASQKQAQIYNAYVSSTSSHSSSSSQSESESLSPSLTLSPTSLSISINPSTSTEKKLQNALKPQSKRNKQMSVSDQSGADVAIACPAITSPFLSSSSGINIADTNFHGEATLPFQNSVEDDVRSVMPGGKGEDEYDENRGISRKGFIRGVVPDVEWERKLEDNIKVLSESYSKFPTPLDKSMKVRITVSLLIFIIFWLSLFLAAIISGFANWREPDAIFLSGIEVPVLIMIRYFAFRLVHPAAASFTSPVPITFSESTNPVWKNDSHLSSNRTLLKNIMVGLSDYFEAIYTGIHYSKVAHIGTGDELLNHYIELQTSNPYKTDILFDSSQCVFNNKTLCDMPITDRIPGVGSNVYGIQSLISRLRLNILYISFENMEEYPLPIDATSPLYQYINAALEYDIVEGLQTYTKALYDKYVSNANSSEKMIMIISIICCVVVILSFFIVMLPIRSSALNHEHQTDKLRCLLPIEEGEREMVLLQSMRTYISHWDENHEKMMMCGELVVEDIKEGGDSSVIAQGMITLIQLCVLVLRSEEREMEQTDFLSIAEFRAHQQDHTKIIQRLTFLYDTMNSGSEAVLMGCKRVLSSIFDEHFTVVDQVFAKRVLEDAEEQNEELTKRKDEARPSVMMSDGVEMLEFREDHHLETPTQMIDFDELTSENHQSSDSDLSDLDSTTDDNASLEKR
ncbi:uncharacterized protein MONOS_4271 [Monocercomonoides exilis]|uniref:uncharacterized protein n=1 Tax=Monocercomonoides exilis TaxID=2049356 RepID=UPI00355A7557|nr:hypothetical protein MONOS_4271 [Monocercomonoides exilis]|eukprot:MONOS_4271.1-p1 / transcript=MONOS_4271.1 / gene=MONOS_4271 / organism=Monocercomonoides_exilis_PA203 / gene_product=unspecified product / transcript_product=unspecified product / location=Mono_scaffold00111:78274-87942(-) / protein_length=3223 / sequence_SO=supercontig / SO=protein_coding / is_pseudo=false